MARAPHAAPSNPRRTGKVSQQNSLTSGVFLNSEPIALIMRRSIAKVEFTVQEPFAAVSSAPMLNTSSENSSDISL